MATTTTDRTRELWCVRLGSAFRTALACTIVGCTTLYGPAPLRSKLTFPAFSYMTTILIVSDATLGDTLRGCWHALYATLQVVPLAMLSLWVIGPAHFSRSLAALAVALSSFVVALPESTHLMSKRIAFGQIVIVYVGAVIHGAGTEAFMHPIHVALSTALGGFASVLALLFPYPRLACCEVRKICRQYAENASERVNLFVKAFSAQDNAAALDAISQAKIFSETGARLLLSIKLIQEGRLWERPQIRFLKPHCINPGDRLQDMDIPIKGMEIALTSCTSFPVSMINEELRDALRRVQVQIGLKLEQAKCFLPFDATTAPETKGEILDKSLQTLKTISPTHNDLPAFFFMFCMKLLQDDSPIARNTESILEIPYTEESRDSRKQANYSFKRIWSHWDMKPRLVFAFKCSLSLGLAVLFGLIFNKENGYWSGLTIAISFATGRQATFTVANARAQGTVMGSIYGVLGCFIFQRFVEVRFLTLLPWIVFTSFLRHSRMYGEAGGISAVIGALLILGRKNYGAPSEFAIARITEAFIGLFCFIMVEILLKPMRAATLAKIQLSQSLGALRECIEEILLCGDQKDMPAFAFLALREKQKKLKTHVNELEKFTGEAELEPNFWFLPFHGACYKKLLGHLSKTVDLLLFVAYKIEFILRVSQTFGVSWKDLPEFINGDLELFKKKVGSSLKCLEEVTLIKSLAILEKELQKKNTSHDLELGKLPNVNEFKVSTTDEEEDEKICSSLLQHSKEVTEKINANEGEEELKNQMVLCLSALGFCISSLMRETKGLELAVKELVQWEGPSRHRHV